MTKKEYKSDDITIVWEPRKCIHSAICAKGLPNVFRPQEKPWINIDGASNNDIMAQIDKCPSGALSYYHNDQADKKDPQVQIKVEVIGKGPLILHGTCSIIHKDGVEEIRENRVSLCRCGESKNKPFCDGSHRESEFDV